MRRLMNRRTFFAAGTVAVVAPVCRLAPSSDTVDAFSTFEERVLSEIYARLQIPRELVFGEVASEGVEL